MEPIKIKGTGAIGKSKEFNNKVDLKRKSVSFNASDPNQKEMLRYVSSQSNFSGYIKNLIMRDMLKHTGGASN